MNRIRSIVFTVVIALAAVIFTLVLFPLVFFGENTAKRIIRWWTHLALGAMAIIAGVTYRIEGRENIPAGGALIVSNHQSLWETIVLNILLSHPVVILKKELLRIPVYGWWALRAGNIAIDRKGGAKELRRIRETAAARIESGAQIVVFPEGTRVDPGETAPYQPGVAGIYLAAGAPCVPIAHDSGRFWRKLGGALNPGVITLRILEPIPPGLDRRTFQREIETRINEARPDLERSTPAPAREALHVG